MKNQSESAKRRLIRNECRAYWDSLAKPIASLGLMEENIAKIAGVQGTADPAKLDISRRALLIFCADHGVVREGVTQTGQEVTAQVAENFALGKSTSNIFARQVNCDVYPVDIGMNSEPLEASGVAWNSGTADGSVTQPLFGTGAEPGQNTESIGKFDYESLCTDRLNNFKIADGSRDLAMEPAMSMDQCRKALETGKELVHVLKERGCSLIATGEMGIGNTTPSSCLASIFLNLSSDEVVGRGAGLSEKGLEKKRRVVAQAVRRVQEKQMTDPVAILAEVGGYDIAGMAGAFLGGAEYGVTMIIDGAISAVAALAASKIDPDVTDFLLASHVSEEKTGREALNALGLEAMIHGRMCLGEGAGALALMPLLDLAMAEYKEMGSFSGYGIEAYHRFGNEPDRERTMPAKDADENVPVEKLK